jgi:negative regulator of sigma E activity
MNRTDDQSPHALQGIPGDTQPQAQLSAFLDGELDGQASRFLLRRLEHDAALRQCWDDWHVAGACLRRSPIRLLPAGFAGRVSAALEQERVPRRGHAVLRWAGGVAVAASVAVLALLAAQPQPSVAPGPDAPSMAASGQVAEAPLRESDLTPEHARVAAQTVAAVQGPQLATDRYGRDVITDPRIEAYLVRHNQALQAQGRGGFLPYVQVVAQPAQGTVRPAGDNR